MNARKTILHPIACPTDLSGLSRKVLRKAYGLAQQEGARLILLHVREPQEVVEGEFGMIPPEPAPAEETIRAELLRLVPANAPIKVDCLVAHGDVAQEIVRAATETDSDLIVLASHGPRNFLSHWLHANVAEHVAKEAPCEVMSVEDTPVAQEEPVFLD